MMDKEGFDSLAFAILSQAVRDYREAARTLARPRGAICGPAEKEKDMRARREVEEVTAFLRSGWFECLSDMDGGYILRRLEGEAKGPA